MNGGKELRYLDRIGEACELCALWVCEAKDGFGTIPSRVSLFVDSVDELC